MENQTGIAVNMGDAMPNREEQHKSVARYALHLVEQGTMPVSEMKNVQTLMSWLHAIINGDLILMDRAPDGKAEGNK